MDVLNACLRTLCTPLRLLGRPIIVSEPCVGLGGFREMCKRGDCEYHPANSMDIDASLKSFYQAREDLDNYPTGGSVIMVGNEGDLLKVTLPDLQPSEGFISGTP